jgi:hypothetical protein
MCRAVVVVANMRIRKVCVSVCAVMAPACMIKVTTVADVAAVPAI